MHPFRIQPRHALQNGDYARRLAFCRWFVAQQPNFSRRILFGDEAAFKLNGEVNTWNVRSYAEHGNGPRNFTYDVPNSREKVTVWVGLVDNNVIGPYFCDANVNGQKLPRYDK